MRTNKKYLYDLIVDYKQASSDVAELFRSEESYTCKRCLKECILFFNPRKGGYVSCRLCDNCRSEVYNHWTK